MAPTRLEAVQRSLEEKWFSQAAAEQISRGRRQSSRAVYDSKGRIFSRWCSDQSVDPFEITIQKLADFFLFLFHEKGLNPRTIKGYRSAISSTISSCGSRTEFTNSPELASLIHSFQLERPPQRKIAPQWNLSLVLQALLKPPFEPIHACDLKSLTLKTVFLVALASGRRRSEIHALCYDSHHYRQNKGQGLLTLYPDLDFVAKNQVLDSVAEPIKLKAFTSVGSEDFDRKLCPVRALLQYRKMTSSPGCRKGRKKLFISYKPSKTDEIKKASISSWIVKLIRLAYSTEGSTHHETTWISPSRPPLFEEILCSPGAMCPVYEKGMRHACVVGLLPPDTGGHSPNFLLLMGDIIPTRNISHVVSWWVLVIKTKINSKFYEFLDRWLLLA